MYKQKKITDVGIDMDGVLYPFMDAFKKYCENVLERSDFPEPTHWNFYEDWGISKKSFDAMLSSASVTHRLFASEPPMQFARGGWEMMRDMNVKIHVITARPTEAWSQTADWLHKHGMVPDHLHFTQDKTILAHTAKEHSAMLDDHYVYYKQLDDAGVLAVLHDHPWNKQHDVLFRVNSLVDFVQLINRVNKREISWQPTSVNKYYTMQQV
jgi:hypothetical protein